MEDLVTMSLGLGGLLAVVNAVRAVIECATFRTIRPPKQVALSEILLRNKHFTTIEAPAVASLFAGLLVSLSASYIFSGLRAADSEELPVELYVGSALFIAAAAALILTVRFAFNKYGDETSAIDSPFVAESAALAFARDPEASPFDIDLIARKLEEWEANLPSHAMGIGHVAPSASLRSALERSRGTKGLVSVVRADLRIAIASVRQSSWRFGWPLISVVLILLATLGWPYMSDSPALITTSLALTLLGVNLLGVAIAAFSMIARSHRGRLWHDIYSDAMDGAHSAISEAKAVGTRAASAEGDPSHRCRCVGADVPAPAWEIRIFGVVLSIGRRSRS